MASGVTCADFLEWTVQELKCFLAMRALSQEGTKLDLAARALVAFEKKEPVRQDLGDLEEEFKGTYTKMLNDYKIPDPIKISDQNWMDNVSLWPQVDLGKVFAFVIEKKAFETEYIGQYKARKAYSYFMSRFVRKIFVNEVSEEKVLLKAKVTQSQNEDPREAWVLCSKSGDVLCGYCTCTAGFAECCNHVVAILYKVEFAYSKGIIDPACTDVACSWKVSTQRDVQFMKIKDIQIKKHDVTKRNKKGLVQSEFKKTFNPRPVEFRGKEAERVQAFFTKLRDEQPTAAVLKCEEPPRKHACPDPFPIIAEEIYEQNPDKSEQDLVSLCQKKCPLTKIPSTNIKTRPALKNVYIPRSIKREPREEVPKENSTKNSSYQKKNIAKNIAENDTSVSKEEVWIDSSIKQESDVATDCKKDSDDVKDKGFQQGSLLELMTLKGLG